MTIGAAPVGGATASPRTSRETARFPMSRWRLSSSSDCPELGVSERLATARVDSRSFLRRRFAEDFRCISSELWGDSGNRTLFVYPVASELCLRGEPGRLTLAAAVAPGRD